MGCKMLGIRVFFWSLAYVLASECILGLGAVVLECDLLFLCCSAFLSVCLSGLSAITDVSTDYLTSFYNNYLGHKSKLAQHKLNPGLSWPSKMIPILNMF